MNITLFSEYIISYFHIAISLGLSLEPSMSDLHLPVALAWNAVTCGGPGWS